MAEAERDFADDIEHDPYDPLDTERAEVKTLSLQEEADATVRQRLERRAQAYKRMIANMTDEDKAIVLTDLNWFCMGDRAVFHENERVHCLLTGRQEVFQRIQDHTRLDLDELVLKYTKPSTQ